MRLSERQMMMRPIVVVADRSRSCKNPAPKKARARAPRVRPKPHSAAPQANCFLWVPMWHPKNAFSPYVTIFWGSPSALLPICFVSSVVPSSSFVLPVSPPFPFFFLHSHPLLSVLPSLPSILPKCVSLSPPPPSPPSIFDVEPAPLHPRLRRGFVQASKSGTMLLGFRWETSELWT